MKNTILALLMIFCTLCFAGCGTTESNEAESAENAADAIKSFGVVYDSSEFDYICSKYPDATPYQYTNMDEAVIALEADGVDAVVGSREQLKLYAEKYADLCLLDDSFNDEHFCLGAKSADAVSYVNSTVEELENDKTLDAIRSKWIAGEDVEINHPKGSSANGLLIMGIVNNYPMAYSIDGEYDGMEIDIAKHVAYRMDRELKVVTYADEEELISALKKGDINIIGGGLISEHEAEGITYCNPYYTKCSGYLIKNINE